jgi:hypothetical protein
MERQMKAAGSLNDENSPVRRYLDWLCLRIQLMDPFCGAAMFHPGVLAQAVPGLLPGDGS